MEKLSVEEIEALLKFEGMDVAYKKPFESQIPRCVVSSFTYWVESAGPTKEAAFRNAWETYNRLIGRNKNR